MSESTEPGPRPGPNTMRAADDFDVIGARAAALRRGCTCYTTWRDPACALHGDAALGLPVSALIADIQAAPTLDEARHVLNRHLAAHGST